MVRGGGPNTEFDPVSKVEDADDDGELDSNENDGIATAPHDNSDGDLDGDYPVKSGSSWVFTNDWNPHDIDADGKIEWPLGDTAGDYTKAHVVMRTVTHEMGHAVGIEMNACLDNTCAMREMGPNYDRHGHFCETCRTLIFIHNN